MRSAVRLEGLAWQGGFSRRRPRPRARRRCLGVLCRRPGRRERAGLENRWRIFRRAAAIPAELTPVPLVLWTAKIQPAPQRSPFANPTTIVRPPGMEVSMRPLIMVSVLAWSPALAASPPLCTLPAPNAIAVADQRAAAPTSAELIQ